MASLKRKTIIAGETLFNRGDLPDYAYLVEEGMLEVFFEEKGHQLLLGVIETGDLIGEMAIIDNLPRTATVKAKTDCTLLTINSEQFLDRIESSETIIRSLINSLLNRYRRTLEVKNTANNEQHTVLTQQLASFQYILEPSAFKKIKLETQLKEALSQEALELRFQPVMHIASKEIVGYEALVRWNHPDEGFISPAKLIQLAEETSLIVEIGEYVIDKVCQALIKLKEKEPSKPHFIAVNVSPKQLIHDGFIERIIARVEQYGLPPHSIEIEITEHQLANEQKLIEAIQKCHAHDIEVSLDDFGIGYSNLTQVHKFDFDTIKIDQAFVRFIDSDPKSSILLQSIIDMCNSLGTATLVEGVENEMILNNLAEFGCDYAQGYHIGKPMELSEIT